MTIIGVVTGSGLRLLGVPFPAALGLLAGILTFVPYVGTVISAIPAALLAFTIDARLALYTILLYTGAHTLEGYILVPLVQKRAAHLPPTRSCTPSVRDGARCGSAAPASKRSSSTNSFPDCSIAISPKPGTAAN
jgi:hypothetical protein